MLFRSPAAEIGTSLERAGITDRFVQYQREVAGPGEVLSLKLPEDTSQQAVAAVQQDFPGANFQLLSTESVGAVVGGELLKQAGWAVLLAMVAIMIYVAFRFGEFAYGLGALVALLHDVLMCVAWFCLTGRTFSLPAVAALLTVIGYSINDKIGRAHV